MTVIPNQVRFCEAKLSSMEIDIVDMVCVAPLSAAVGSRGARFDTFRRFRLSF